jgi:hypothetical protein
VLLLSGVPVDVLHFLASLFRACLYLLLLSLTFSRLSRFDVVVCRLVGVLGDVLHFLAFLSLVLDVLVGGLVVVPVRTNIQLLGQMAPGLGSQHRPREWTLE